MSLIQKRIFQGVKNVKNCILTLNFTISGQLGSLRHAFGWSWNFQKLMQVRYTSDLIRAFRLWKFSFQDQRVHTIEKKTMWNIFSIFAVKYSSTKELLHKPSEIQSNITGTLLGKLNIIFFFFGGGALSYKILPPVIIKTWEIAIFWVLWGPGNQCGIQWYFTILWISQVSASIIWVKTVLTLN